MLLSKTQLEDAEKWLKSQGAKLKNEEKTYIFASTAKARKRSIFRYFIVVFMVLSASFMATIWYRTEKAATADRVAALLVEAESLANKGEIKAAIALYSNAIELDPGRGEAYYNRGKLYYQEGKLNEAINNFGKAIELNQANTAALLDRGQALLQKSDYASALADFESAARLESKNPTIYLYIGSVKANQGDNRGAIGEYSRAIEIDPNFVQAYFNRGIAFEKSDDKKAAVADFEKILTLPNVDSQSIKAAKARLAQLGIVPPTQLKQVITKLSVSIFYTNIDDQEEVRRIFKNLKTKDIIVKSIQYQKRPALSSVRFFSPQDEEGAQTVKLNVEKVLAENGFNVRLNTRFIEEEKREPGVIEVWLPSLTLPLLPSRQLYKK